MSAGVRHEQPQDQLEDGRLAAAGLAGDHERLAFARLQRDARRIGWSNVRLTSSSSITGLP
jgi:hypothetical protein